MRAQAVVAPGRPLEPLDLPLPAPGPGEVRVRVRACGVCRTDLHVADGDLAPRAYPIVPGHEVVGVVEALGDGVAGLALGDRVGVPWLGWTCGTCEACVAGRENLCAQARFTGFDRHGGFAEALVADARYCLPIPAGFGDVEAAPLLCAGLIGYRAWRMAGEGRRLGIYGFGAAAHLVAQVARNAGQEVLAFTRPGDREAQAFALALGAAWAGGSDEAPPRPLDAALLFAPVGALVPAALRAVRPGGTVVCAGIHMSDVPAFPYAILWGERSVRSVANLTRRDGREFLALAAKGGLRTRVEPLPLDRAEEALGRLRAGQVSGALVLVPAG